MELNTYNYKTTELVDGFPPTEGHEDGDYARVFDTTTKTQVAGFEMIFGEWYLIATFNGWTPGGNPA